MSFVQFLQLCDSLLWSRFLIYLLIAVGLYLTVRLKGMQLRYLPMALKLVFSRHDDKAEGDISQFQSLMMALAATIGIGSIAGMATAVIGGGYGAIFWMWVVAFIGMVTKYAEAILAVKYRSVDARGQMAGGPMYYIQRGLKSRFLGASFAVFGALAAFGGGNLIQSHSIADALFDLFAFPHIWTGIILAVLVTMIVIGGIKGLGRVNALLVPVMALIYIAGGLLILLLRIEYIPGVFRDIFYGAFSQQSIAGGLIGGNVLMAMQMGVARGISSNEAGLGSSPIASAAAKTDVPGRQALISMSGVFLSSFVICTITVLVLGVSGVVGQRAASGALLNGAQLVMHAFGSVLPGSKIIVVIGLLLFGFSTIIGWSYYGEKCMEFLFGLRILAFYRALFIIVVFLGAIGSIDIVWPLADIMNGLMALPNLLGLLLMSGVIISESQIFFKQLELEKL